MTPGRSPFPPPGAAGSLAEGGCRESGLRRRRPRALPAPSGGVAAKWKRLVIGKGTQGFLLFAYTAAVLAGTLLVEGRPGVVTNLVPFDDLVRLRASAGKAGVLSNRFVLGLLGLVGNLVMFAVWGFLAWKFVDGRGRARWRNHAEVVFFGLVFSVGIETVQFFLPTRAADVNDVFWNALGAGLGALLGHLHASVRLDWA
ncbi:MAG: VanZ family protein [Holophagales bacterium]|nr:VanZ family protein [Holophagales bacterium]